MKPKNATCATVDAYQLVTQDPTVIIWVQHTVSEHNVGDGEEASVKASMDSCIDRHMAWGLNANGDHRGHCSCSNANKGLDHVSAMVGIFINAHRHLQTIAIQ